MRQTAGWRVDVQPEYYGLAAFARLTPPGSRILQGARRPTRAATWAVRTPQGQTHVVVTNVGSSKATVAVKAPQTPKDATVETLSASGGLSGSKNVTLGGQAIDPNTGMLAGTLLSPTVHPTNGAYNVTVPSAAAEILTFRS